LTGGRCAARLLQSRQPIDVSPLKPFHFAAPLIERIA
jgi:hypothetical protein